MKVLKSLRAHGVWLFVVLLASGLIGCGPKEALYHGVTPSPDGAYFDVASLMPSCSCVTLRNIAPGEMPVEIVTMLHTTEVGSQVLASGVETRFGFDWAGPDNSDTYSLEAYPLEPNGRGGMRRGAKPLTPVANYLEPLWHTDVDCKKIDCPFGTLGMDKVINSATAGGQPVTRSHGVELTAGGQQIGAGSTPNSCGCVLLANASPERQTVTLRSSFHARNEGLMEIPWDPTSNAQPVNLIGFDWAGSEDEDRYLINVVGEEGSEMKGASPTRVLRAQDFVKIVGQMDQLECSAEGAVLRLPSQPGMSVAGGTAPPPQLSVVCPFGTLSMNERVTAAGKATQPTGKGSPK